MVQPTGYARFTMKAREHGGVVHQLRVQHLHGDGSFHSALVTQIDSAHGADADELSDLDLFG
jgi:hypothetical protein